MLELLLGLGLLGALIVLPILLIGFLLKLAIRLILLPFRIAGAAIGIAAGAVALAVGLVGAVLGVVLAGVAAAGALLLLPFVPFLLAVAFVLVLVRAGRPRAVA